MLAAAAAAIVDLYGQMGDVQKELQQEQWRSELSQVLQRQLPQIRKWNSMQVRRHTKLCWSLGYLSACRWMHTVGCCRQPCCCNIVLEGVGRSSQMVTGVPAAWDGGKTHVLKLDLGRSTGAHQALT